MAFQISSTSIFRSSRMGLICVADITDREHAGMTTNQYMQEIIKYKVPLKLDIETLFRALHRSMSFWFSVGTHNCYISKVIVGIEFCPKRKF